MDDYIQSQSRAAYAVGNKMLMCKDCKYRIDEGPTGYCQKYKRGETRKPNSVLVGGPCPVYKKEDADNSQR